MTVDFSELSLEDAKAQAVAAVKRASGWPPHLYKAVSDSMSKRLADGVEPEYLSGLEFDLWYAIETSKALSALSARAPQHDDHSDDSSKDHHSPDDGKR